MTPHPEERSPKRRRRIAALVVILIGSTWFTLFGRGRPAVETAAVHREDLALTVQASGELDAVRSSEIGPIPAAEIWNYKISMIAPESRQVRKDEPILGFDTTSLQEDLLKRQDEYDSSVKELEKRNVDLTIQLKDLDLQLAEAESRLRKQELKAEAPDALVEARDLRLARLDFDLARKEVASLRVKIEGTRLSGEADQEALAGKRDRAAARIREIQESIARMTIKAPQDGIVIYNADWQGDKKKVGDTVWRAEKVLKIPDLSEMMGKAEVDEADAGRLAIGQPAVIRLDALPDSEFAGGIRSIGRVVQRKRNENQKVNPVELSIDRTDPQRMRPGMRFRAEIEIERVSGALVASRDTVFLHESGAVVFKRSGRRFVETPVKIGRRNAKLVEILEGAVEGDLLARRDLSAAGETAAVPVAGGAGS
jgi:HlyD family secretion protein